MATIQKSEGKTGISYKITVTYGKDANGKKNRYYKTWTPSGTMSASKMEKEVQKAAIQFEEEIKQGFRLDSSQSFHDYAEYVIALKESNGLKPNTIKSYRSILKRIDPVFGGMKITDIRPQTLNDFYNSLRTAHNKYNDIKATGKQELLRAMSESGITRDSLSKLAHISHTTATEACRGNPISLEKAMAISKALQVDVNDMFDLSQSIKPLSSKTILEHHRFIHTVLDQAEKEMLVAYNAASKATPPKTHRKTPNYFQPEEIWKILELLDKEPEQWRIITHLLIVTGCRRGEIAGLKWEKVDLEKGILEISNNLMYSQELGVYEAATKTGETRYIHIPAESVDLLRKHKACQAACRLKAGDRWNDLGFLFTQWDGKPINPSSITFWLNKFSKKNHLRHINPHAFRHSVASILIANGTDIVTVSKQLGHAQVSTTGDIYSHIIAKSQAEASECIATVMLRSREKQHG